MPWSSGDSLSPSNLNNKGFVVYNAKQYGAVGDGSADDTVAVQAALNAASAASAQEVFLPAGTYKVSTLSLPQNVILRGVGPRLDHASNTKSATVLLRGSSDTMLQAIGSTTTRHHGASLRDLTVDGNPSSGYTGTVLDHSRSVGFYTDRFEVIDNLGTAVYGAEVFDAQFNALWVRNSGNSGPNQAAIVLSDSTVEGTDRVTFNNLHSEANRYTHILIDAAGGSGDINKWITFNNPKVHDYLTASSITVPLFDAQNINNMQVLGGMFSSVANGPTAIRSNASFSYIQAIIDTAGPGYAVEVTGGQRSHYDLIVTSSSLSTAVSIGPNASNIDIQLVKHGTGSFYTDNGTNSLIRVAQDGTDITLVGKSGVTATGKLYLDGGGDTYMSEVAANQIRFTVAGQTSFDVTSKAIWAPQSISLYSMTTTLTSAASNRGFLYADSASSLYWVNGSGVSTLLA